ncbi:MAG: F0F1 ATP synthase subunit C [Gemmatimonadetes bacterium]|nr:F0F1 ATP synthase subunit C [Gemmatimonadota bacterium]NIR79629.1 F0F1 ATP synthase subunit C [Gemmatimonadota bacterium]NIT88325.1 F0F1 ATP synthase subunit C [Gemmatimonadota bacterium]NIU32138.1 F0F1 ATP synthase subunit C [Gemmatimonadota bacterium]NIU36711.1 F0F1 ATP synthase subunit C [Gemmatimonadota bacterium]
METIELVAGISIAVAGLTIAVGSIAPALGEARALAQALESIAQQPDMANTVTRTLFVGMAMVESTAIYCLVVSLILIFANPFWTHVIQVGG